MDVRTFRAASIQDALRQVRDTLGPNASVVDTREVRRGRLGLFSQSLIEVDARLDDQAAHPLVITAAAPSGAVVGKPSDESRGSSVNTLPLTSSNLETSNLASAKPIGSHTGDPVSISQSKRTRVATVPRKDVLANIMSQLLANDLPGGLANELVAEAAAQCSSGEFDEAVLRAALINVVAARLPVSGALEHTLGSQQVVAMVGSTGVGKTSTLAKIAAGFTNRANFQVGLISLDTVRLGAVDQLLYYAEQLTAPLEVVSSANDVKRALDRLGGCDLILLDTAGRAPGDIQHLKDLAACLLAARPHSIHLVVSAGSSKQHLESTLKKFALVKPTNLLLTKLDEAAGFASWLPVLSTTGLPVSYLTTGQQVPGDIEEANSRHLATALLGIE